MPSDPHNNNNSEENRSQGSDSASPQPPETEATTSSEELLTSILNFSVQLLQTILDGTYKTKDEITAAVHKIVPTDLIQLADQLNSKITTTFNPTTKNNVGDDVTTLTREIDLLKLDIIKLKDQVAKLKKSQEK